MKRSIVVSVAALVALGSYALGAVTQKPLVQTYDKIADSILAAKHSEKAVVGAILLSHRQGAATAAAAKKWDEVAAHLALWANEGDNAVGGIRKRLLEGGHHHHAAGEAQGLYEEGYVVVTRAAKQRLLESARALGQMAAAPKAEALAAEWQKVEAVYAELSARK